MRTLLSFFWHPASVEEPEDNMASTGGQGSRQLSRTGYRQSISNQQSPTIMPPTIDSLHLGYPNGEASTTNLPSKLGCQLYQIAQNWEKQNEATVVGMKKVIGNLETERDHYRKHYQDLSDQYENLRCSIASKSQAQDPMETENYYIHAFNELQCDVENWAANQTMKESEPVPIIDVADLITHCGDYGAKSAQYFRSEKFKVEVEEVQKMTADRLRILVLQHVVSLFIFDQVLDRFACGLENSISQYLKNVEDKLFTQGTGLERSY